MSKVPNCKERRHTWLRKNSGCKENPGVFGIGGSAVSITEVCPHCGAERNKVVGDVNYPSRNHGWRYTAGVEE